MSHAPQAPWSAGAPAPAFFQHAAEGGSSRCRSPRRASPAGDRDRHRHSALPLACVVAAAALLLLAAKPCAAQDSYIEGDSEIFMYQSGTQWEVYTLSETYLTPDLAYYYGAYVEAYIYQTYNGHTYWSYANADQQPYENDAVVEFYGPVLSGCDYQLISNHAVDAYWIEYADGSDYYYNPDAFAFAPGEDYGGEDFLPSEGGPVYSYEELIYLGSTEAELDAAPPSNLSLNPSSAPVGTSGTITVTGNNLLDLCTGNTTVSITGSNITVTLDPTSLTLTQATVDYSIADNASTGSQTLKLTTCFGSGSAGFEVGDPTPVINQVTPYSWPASQQTNFTITGSGFGSAPTLQVSGTGVSCCTGVTTGDTQITGTATLTSGASGLATITVTSTGYLGNGFISTGGSGGTTNSATAQVPIGPSGHAADNSVGPGYGRQRIELQRSQHRRNSAGRGGPTDCHHRLRPRALAAERHGTERGLDANGARVERGGRV